MNNALQVALRLLTRRDYAALELTRKLMARGHARSDVEEAVRYCQKQGFQSDERFVEMICRARVSQGYGPLKIEQELKRVGIDSAPMAQYFFKEPVDWCLLAREVLRRNAWRFSLSGSSPSPSPSPSSRISDKPRDDVDGDDAVVLYDIKKQQRFLMSRGFSFDVIQVVLREKKTYEDC
ncbi:MAG: regulatory protein RecX [Gammaproteobacteria bacterium]|nr:regulatory protein RecX [Gammaproteobacteria bacterium]